MSDLLVPVGIFSSIIGAMIGAIVVLVIRIRALEQVEDRLKKLEDRLK